VVTQLIAPREVNGIHISPVALGTMRFVDKGLSKEELTYLIEFLYKEVGINIHHSSYEYNSYSLYCDALHSIKYKADLKHICKLSAPDFKEENFSSNSLREKVCKEIKTLGIERIDFLQWLFRSEPIDDVIRLDKLKDKLNDVEYCFQNLIQEGLIGVVGTFPYSVRFGKHVSERITNVSGWITYFNLLEQEYVDNLSNEWMIGLRPLAAGRLLSHFQQLDDAMLQNIVPLGNSKTEQVLHICLAYCLANTQVKTNVLSVNSLEQAESLSRILQSVEPLSQNKMEQLLNLL